MPTTSPQNPVRVLVKRKYVGVIDGKNMLAFSTVPESIRRLFETIQGASDSLVCRDQFIQSWEALR